MTQADIIVVGGGAGGICAAVASARTGARTLLLEAAPEVGGTGVFSPVSLVCRFHDAWHRPINMGIHRELFFEIYRHSTRDFRSDSPRLTYDEKVLAERYRALIEGEPLLSVRTGSRVADARVEGRRLAAVVLADGSEWRAKAWVDGTADGNLADLAGCETMYGRAEDGAVQSATLTFTVSNIDAGSLKDPDLTTRGGQASLWNELDALYRAAREAGETSNPKRNVVCFPYPDGQRLLFNSNEVLGVDPRDPASVEDAKATGRRLVDELFAILRKHPAFAEAQLDAVSSKMGIREGRRVVGDYVLTEEDCFGEARFDDMVAACAYDIDIHDPHGGPTRLEAIPGSGYYHIPQRSLVARDLDNLALGSRCISGTHEAHSSYRVISGVTALGQAAGTHAALAARFRDGALRDVPAAETRYVLHQQLQFIEGERIQPDGYRVAETR